MKFESKTAARPGKGLVAVVAALIVALGAAQAQTNPNPAARTHVKIVNGQGVKYSSKLRKVIELNFTFNFHHRDSKPLISATLKRIAGAYAINGDSAFTVESHIGPSNGTATASATTILPDFNLADLLSGQVIFSNQISGMGSSALGAAHRTAIEVAIRDSGRGYFHLHGSGDDETKQWSWFTNSLHPMNYKSHGDRTLGPVYKNPVEKDHIVTENVLTQGMTNATVPTSVDGGGNEVLTEQPTRQIRNEWYRFGDDIRANPTLAQNLTVLSLYDPRNLGTALPAEYRRKGGNMYTYLFKVGNGMTQYLPAGHDNTEIMATGGFDGGVGDWDRYFAQVLFYLAGYNQTPCDESCNGLPVVSAENRLTGQTYTATSVRGYTLVSSDLKLDNARPGFTYIREAPYEARLVNASGKVVMQSRGKASRFAFDASRLSDGIYFMQVKIDGMSRMHRYAVAGGI